MKKTNVERFRGWREGALPCCDGDELAAEQQESNGQSQETAIGLTVCGRVLCRVAEKQSSCRSLSGKGECCHQAGDLGHRRGIVTISRYSHPVILLRCEGHDFDQRLSPFPKPHDDLSDLLRGQTSNSDGSRLG